MKTLKFIPFFLVLVCILFGCEKKSNEITITGYLEGIEDGTVFELNQINEGSRSFTLVAVDTLKKGSLKITLTDSIPEARKMMLMARGEGFPPTWLDIWVTPGAEIEITGKDKLLRTWDVTSNVKEQQEQNKYITATKDYERQTQAIMRDAYGWFDKMRNPEADEQSIQLARHTIDSLYKINDSLNIQILKEELRLMQESSHVDLVFMDKLKHHSTGVRYEQDHPCAECLTPLYERLSEEQKNSETGKSIYLNLNPPKVVKDGDDMADTDLFDLEGNLHHLADYKGKYLLLDFWSAGCGPCIMAIPEMKEISEEYKDKVTLVSLSMDDKETWIEVSKNKGITWVNLNDFRGDEGITLNYGVTGIPHYVMISPEGKVLTSWTGYGKGSLKAKIKEIVQ